MFGSKINGFQQTQHRAETASLGTKSNSPYKVTEILLCSSDNRPELIIFKTSIIFNDTVTDKTTRIKKKKHRLGCQLITKSAPKISENQKLIFYLLIPQGNIR